MSTDSAKLASHALTILNHYQNKKPNASKIITAMTAYLSHCIDKSNHYNVCSLNYKKCCLDLPAKV